MNIETEIEEDLVYDITVEGDIVVDGVISEN